MFRELSVQLVSSLETHNSTVLVIISGDCKRESGTEHVALIDTMYMASKITGAHTVSIASDGESQ